jgi:hypothetical protein
MSIFELVSDVCLTACALIAPLSMFGATYYLARHTEVALRLMAVAYLLGALALTAAASWALEQIWS